MLSKTPSKGNILKLTKDDLNIINHFPYTVFNLPF